MQCKNYRKTLKLPKSMPDRYFEAYVDVVHCVGLTLLIQTPEAANLAWYAVELCSK